MTMSLSPRGQTAGIAIPKSSSLLKVAVFTEVADVASPLPTVQAPSVVAATAVDTSARRLLDRSSPSPSSSAGPRLRRPRSPGKPEASQGAARLTVPLRHVSIHLPAGAHVRAQNRNLGLGLVVTGGAAQVQRAAGSWLLRQVVGHLQEATLQGGQLIYLRGHVSLFGMPVLRLAWLPQRLVNWLSGAETLQNAIDFLIHQGLHDAQKDHGHAELDLEAVVGPLGTLARLDLSALAQGPVVADLREPASLRLQLRATPATRPAAVAQANPGLTRVNFAQPHYPIQLASLRVPVSVRSLAVTPEAILAPVQLDRATPVQLGTFTAFRLPMTATGKPSALSRALARGTYSAPLSPCLVPVGVPAEIHLQWQGEVGAHVDLAHRLGGMDLRVRGASPFYLSLGSEGAPSLTLRLDQLRLEHLSAQPLERPRASSISLAHAAGRMLHDYALARPRQQLYGMLSQLPGAQSLVDLLGVGRRLAFFPAWRGLRVGSQLLWHSARASLNWAGRSLTSTPLTKKTSSQEPLPSGDLATWVGLSGASTAGSVWSGVSAETLSDAEAPSFVPDLGSASEMTSRQSSWSGSAASVPLSFTSSSAPAPADGVLSVPPLESLAVVAARLRRAEQRPELATLAVQALHWGALLLLDNAAAPATVTPKHLQVDPDGKMHLLVDVGDGLSAAGNLAATGDLAFTAPELLRRASVGPLSRDRARAAQIFSLGASVLSLGLGGISPFASTMAPMPSHQGAARVLQNALLQAHAAHLRRPLRTPVQAMSQALDRSLDLLRGYGALDGPARQLALVAGQPLRQPPVDEVKNLVLAMVDPEPARRPSLMQICQVLAAIDQEIRSRAT